MAKFFPKLIKSSHAIFYHPHGPCLLYDGTDDDADAVNDDCYADAELHDVDDNDGTDEGGFHNMMDDIHNTQIKILASKYIFLYFLPQLIACHHLTKQII